MQLELSELARRHRLPLPGLHVPPLADPPSHTSMILEGLAATTDVDSTRQRLRPYAFGIAPPRPTAPRCGVTSTIR